MRISIASILAVILICFSSSVVSDQNDPRLEELFTQLKIVNSQEKGNEITDEIWKIWRETSNQQINELMREGISAMSKGQLRRAERLFDEVVFRAPKFAEGWNKRATVYYFLREFQKSASDVRQTLLLEPRHFGATAGLGLIFLSLNYPKNALKAFEKALDINPHLLGPKQQIKFLKDYLQDDSV